MSHFATINRPVAVTAVEFTRALEPLPCRIEIDGISHRFIDRGIRTMVRQGERMLQLVTMTDGTRHYSLRHDAGGWILVSIC